MRVSGTAPVRWTLPRHAVLCELFAWLERQGVRWALLRLPEGGLMAPRGDIDVLLDPDHVRSAIHVLTALGFVRVPRHGDDLHFLQYCAPTDQWLWIHAATSVGFGREHPLPVRGEDNVLVGRCYADGVWQLAADTAFWLLLWHGLAEKGGLKPHHRQALSELGASANPTSDVAATFVAASGAHPGLSGRFVDATRRGDWEDVEAFVPVLAQAAARSGRGHLLNRLRRAVVLGITAACHWRERRGMTVALLGPDGSGKTTLADGIRASVPFPSLFMYMGLTGGALVYAHRLRIPGLVFGVSVAIIWRRYLRSLYHRARGRLVVIDRYVYDAVTPHPRHQRWWQRAARSLMGRICPGPDLVLLLDAPGTVMFNRKYEYSPATLEDWRQRFRSLTGRLPRLEVIDASRDAEAVRIDAVARIWKRYAERWGGRPPDRSSREVVARP